MKFPKQIISFILVFATVISLCSFVTVESSALDLNTGASTIWNVLGHLAGDNVGVDGWLEAVFSKEDSGCPNSPDGFHDWNVQFELANAFGYFNPPCRNCLLNYSEYRNCPDGDVLSVVYSDYVSSLETPSVSSTDLSYSTTYNMNDFSFSTSNSLTSPSSYFMPGDFPSSVSLTRKQSFSSSYYRSYLTFWPNVRSAGYDYQNLTIDAGVPFSLKIYLYDFYFPDYPALSSCPRYHLVKLKEFIGEGVSDSFKVYSDGSVETSLNSSVSYNYFVGEDSYGKYLTVSGVSACSARIDITTSAYLLSPFDSDPVETSVVYSFPAGDNFLTFSFGSSGSGSSGSSSLPDESTRLGPVMQSINNYNIDNSYTDNSTTVNYYLTPNNGETLCSPVVFNESTKVFTIPETGQQFLCDYWIYHYSPDNTLVLNDVEFSGNYLGSYILRLADSSYVIGDTVVPAVWVVYMDEKVYVIPYYTDPETGNIVPLDFQPYSYAMVSQSSCSINGHTYTSDTTQPPTCAASGERKYTCSVCGNEYVEDIPATGIHSYQYAVSQDPTCIVDGVALYTCSVCGDQYTESIPAVGHSYKLIEYVAPEYDENGTAVSAGHYLYECSVCGNQYSETDEIPVTEESWFSWLGGLFKKAISAIVNGFASGIEYLLEHVIGAVSDFIVRVTSWAFNLFDGSALVSWFDWFSEDNAVINNEFAGSGAVSEVDVWAYSFG